MKQTSGAKVPHVEGFFDAATFTISYVVADLDEGAAVIIDPVLDFDPASGRTSTRSADRLLDWIGQRELTLSLVFETHVHADHLTGAAYLRETTGAEVAIGSNITRVQEAFGAIFNAEPEFARDGSQFDRLLEDDATFAVGSLLGRSMRTPGHTPNCMTYLIGDAAFVGDTLFMPDFGTARCDFPGGDARTLYDSIGKILALPEKTRLFMCHDYKAPGRDEYAWETSVAEQRQSNIHVGDGISQDEFVAVREKRDAELGMPRLILPSVQVNMRAGEFPPAENNGVRYLKLPIDML